MIDTRKEKKPKEKGGAIFREMRTEKRRKKTERKKRREAEARKRK